MTSRPVEGETTFGFWLRSDEACRYVGCKSIKGWYMWRVRHGIATDRMGRVSRRDLDLALRVPRKRRAASEAQLASLRLGRNRVKPVEQHQVLQSSHGCAPAEQG